MSNDEAPPRQPALAPQAALKGWLMPLAMVLPLLLAATLVLLLPRGLLASVIYLLAGGYAVLVIALATTRRPGLPSPLAWALLALVAGLLTLSHGYGHWLAPSMPAPTLADAGHLTAYALLAITLWRLAPPGKRSAGAWVDALMVTLAVAVLGWVLMPQHLAAPPWGRLLYPAAGLSLLLLTLALAFLPRPMRGRALLLRGAAMLVAADLAYAQGLGPVTPSQGDALRLLAMGGFVAAAWQGARPPSPAPAPPLWPRLLALGAALASVPGLWLLAPRAHEMTTPLALASLALSLLMLLRLTGALILAKRQAQALRRLSRSDPLTGAANRRGLEEFLAREMALAVRNTSPLSLALLDLDHFRRFNESHGHSGGDILLRALAEAWQPALRPSDLLARFGGEEFAVVLPNADDEACLTVLERLRQRVPYGQTCSAGFARYRPGESPDALIHRASQALYQAKQLGRDRVEGALTY